MQYRVQQQLSEGHLYLLSYVQRKDGASSEFSERFQIHYKHKSQQQEKEIL
jgi:hypothetical protein